MVAALRFVAADFAANPVRSHRSFSAQSVCRGLSLSPLERQVPGTSPESPRVQLNGDDLRREPLEVRKATLTSVLAKAALGLRLCEHLDHADGEVVFRHACRMGLEGIVSKRRDSPYRSGRSADRLKMKNRAHAVVKREMEEDWS
jgi:hypothetical protein